MLRCAVLCGLLAACGSQSEPASSPHDRPRSQPAIAQEPAPAAEPTPSPATEPPTESEPAPAAVLLHAQDDLDGEPGAENVVLYSDGRLEAGHYSGRAEVTGADEYFMSRQSSLRVVVLDQARGLRAVLVTMPTSETEDPPNLYQLFVIDGDRLLRVLATTLGTYGVTELRFPGDGTAHYVEDGWTACDRAGHPTRATREEVVLRFDGHEMREASRIQTHQAQICDELAACPVVYIVSDGGDTAVGEILRDLRGPDEYALQDLDLPAAAGPLHVRLAEEKPEATFLDEVYVEAAGERFSPRACDGPEQPDYCAADWRMQLLQAGESVDLVFDVPDGAAATLFARGYYIPMPAAP